MSKAAEQLAQLKNKRQSAALQVETLGRFRVWAEGREISAKDWGRDKTVQLFQFLVTQRQRRGLHREQILDRLWEDLDEKGGEQSFKVALHGVNKALEPERKSRTEPRFIVRQAQAYQLNLDEIWIDADAMESFIAFGNLWLAQNPEVAKMAYHEAVNLHHGVYLPSRIYEDWTSAERERLQVLALGTTISLGELLLEENPLESIRLAQQALLLDPTWEDAYRLEMQAYLKKGNRPMAIKTYRQCVKTLDEEFGIGPLPETKKLMREIEAI